MATKTMYSRVANLSFTKAVWDESYSTKVLLKGEIGFETDTRKMKVGDGTTTWASLAYVNPDYTLPIASDEVLGGIKSGDVISVNNSTGVISVADVVASTSGAGGSHGLMTAAQAEKLAGVATGAQVNVLEGIKFKGSKATSFSDLTIDGNKKAELDLSGYALLSDIAAALNFKGSKTGNELAALTASQVSNGDVYSCSADQTGATVNFHEGLEYAAVVDGSTLTWTELGKWVDLSGYVQKTQTVNSKALSGNIVLDGSDIALSSNYAIATTAAKPAVGDSIDVAVGKVQKEIDVLNADSSTAGSVDYKVDQAVKIDAITVNGSAATITGKSIPFAEGATNGTISVNGTDVAVHGLGSNAYTSTAYVPETRTVNSKSLDADITLAGSDIALTGYTKASSAAAISATDTVNAAIGKLEYKVDSATTGTVTSVGLSMPSIFTVTGSPVTSSGTLTATLANQNANLVFAGPASGSAAAPSFRALVAADIPTLAASKVQLSGATENNVASIDAYGSYKDSGVAVANLIDKSVDFVTIQCAFEMPS